MPVKTTVNLPWGVRLRVNGHETIGRALCHMGVYDLVLTEGLWRLTETGMKAADIGANVGYFSSLFAARVGNGGAVFSFEPHPRLFETLQANTKNFANCSLFPLALSDKKRAGELFIPADFGANEGTASLEKSDSARVIPVDVGVFDEILAGLTIDIVKIDVEGHELSVFKGGKDVLARTSHIFFEDFEGIKSGAITCLRDMGFEVFRLKKDFFGPTLISVEEGEGLPRWEPPNYLATRSVEFVLQKFAPRGWRCLRS